MREIEDLQNAIENLQSVLIKAFKIDKLLEWMTKKLTKVE